MLGPLFRWEAVELHLSDRARIQGMLDFEAALARAEAGAGVIPASAAPAIVRCCAAERFDEGALAHATARAGNPAIPLVQQLTALVEKDDPGAARFVHWGATSQDVMDTGLVLQLHRDRFATVATVFGLGAGTLGKIARDVSLHAQTEVAELFEPEAAGRGRSSTLPHKQNPVASAVVIAAATRIPGLVATMLSAMVQEDERGLGSWHAEWNTLPEIVSLYGGALHSSTEALAGLRVDAARMERNLELTRGLVFAEAVQTALAPKTGRPAAHRLVEAACVRARSEGRHLRDVLAEDAEASRHLSREELASLFEPRLYLGVSDRLIERVLAGRRSDGPAGSGGS